MWPGNRQPLQGSPSMIPLRSLLRPLLGRLCCEGDDIWRQQKPLILWPLTSLTLVPSVKSSLNKRVATSKSPSGEKYTIRNRRGQACSNSLLLRMRVLGSNTLEEKADGKYCSLLQQNSHQRNCWRWHSLGFCKTYISSEHFQIILRVLLPGLLLLRPY